MRRVAWVTAALLAYPLLVLVVAAGVAAYQPEGPETAVLRTFDADGTAHDNVVRVLRDGQQLWIGSAMWSRRWHARLDTNADVALIPDDLPASYFTAVPLATAESRATVQRLMGRDERALYTLGRLLRGFAPVLPVRLDARRLDVPSPAS